MDIAMFFQFPGILITIGVALLLISIIIIVVAYKSEEKDVDASKLSTNINAANVIHDGYYDNGKPKITIEATSVVENNQVQTEEVKQQEPVMENVNVQIGIKDQIENIHDKEEKKEITEPKEEQKEIVIEPQPEKEPELKEEIKPEEPKTIDVFEEEFSEPSPAKKYRLPELDDEIKKELEKENEFIQTLEVKVEEPKKEENIPAQEPINTIEETTIEQEKETPVQENEFVQELEIKVEENKKEEPKQEEIVIKPEQIIEDDEEIELL